MIMMRELSSSGATQRPARTCAHIASTQPVSASAYRQRVFAAAPAKSHALLTSRSGSLLYRLWDALNAAAVLMPPTSIQRPETSSLPARACLRAVGGQRLAGLGRGPGRQAQSLSDRDMRAS